MSALRAFFCLLVLVVAARAAPVAFEKKTTPGGIVFWYHARPDLPKTTLFAGWRDGIGFTTPGKEGLSLVATGMLRRAASAHALDNIFEALNDIGASGDIWSDGWNTYAMLTGSPRNLAAAANLAQKVLKAPLPDQIDLDRIEAQLVDSVISEGNVAENAAEWAAFRLGAPAFPWNRLRETPELYRAITREDVESWRQRVLARDNLTLAVEGPTSPEELGPLIDKLIDATNAQSGAARRSALQFSARPRTIVIERDQTQTVFYKTAPTDLGDNPARLKSAVAVAVLGDQFESRLMKTVRQQLGDSYGVSAYIANFADHSPLVLSGAVANGKAVEALAAVDREYLRWREEGVTAEELAAAASRFKSGNDAYFRTQGASPRFFVAWMLDGNPPNAMFDYADRLAGYSVEAVNAEIKARFPAPPLLTIIVAPSAAPFHADCVVKSWREVDTCR